MSKLEVEISGDVKKLKSAINDATGQLKGLAKQGIDSGKKVNRNALSAARGIKGLGNETVNAFPALNEFSRIIQDAPYGIQGVANNITQLTTQFGYLTKKTGSAKGALKAMLGSLTGPSGILLAVSAVTTLLVSFGDKLFSSSKNADKLKSSTKGVNHELKNQSAILEALIKDYGNFEKIKEQTTFNTTKEKETVRALFSILRDDLSTTKERERAYSALNKKYSEYLKNVDSKSIHQLTLAERRLNKQLEVREKRIQTLNKLEEVSKGLQLVTLKVEKLRSQNVSMFSKRAKALQAENADLYKLQKQLREALELYTSLDTTIGKVKEQKPIVVPINTVQPAGLTSLDAGGLTGLVLGFTLADAVEKSIEAAKLRMELALEDFNMAADQIIRNNIANTFAGIGEAIGNAMTGAANLGQGLAKVLLSTVGNLMVQLGKLAISIGVGLEKIKEALKNPLKSKLAIAAGVGLIALGSAFKSGAAKIGGSMGTGSVAGAGSSSGFSSGTTFGGARPFSGNLTFTIRGTDLVAVLNSANSQNGIIGGNVSVG